METKNNASDQYNTSSQETGNGQSKSFNMDSLTEMLGGLNIPESLKKYSGTATKAISNLSTTQKIIGGAILLLGATYITRGSKSRLINKFSAMKNKDKSGR